MNNIPFRHDGSGKLFETFADADRDARRCVQKKMEDVIHIFRSGEDLALVRRDLRGNAVTDLTFEGCKYA